MNNTKPWWAPDAQGFLAGAIVLICGMALFARMAYASAIEDKMLDTMITILFSTCLVTVYNFSFGSSRGSAAKDETLNKLALVPSGPPTPGAPVSTITTVTEGKTETKTEPAAAPVVAPAAPVPAVAPVAPPVP